MTTVQRNLKAGWQHVQAYALHWRQVPVAGWLYLAHTGLLTLALSMTFLVFNLAIVAFAIPGWQVGGFTVPFLGVLISLTAVGTGTLAMPLIWLVGKVGFWWSILANSILQILSLLLMAWSPTAGVLLLAGVLAGAGGVLFQTSSVPFMVRLSDSNNRDHLLSASFATNIGMGGIGALIGGVLAVQLAFAFGVAPGSAAAYRMLFVAGAVSLLLALVPLLPLRGRAAVLLAPAAADVRAATGTAPAEAATNGWQRLVARVPVVRRLPPDWYRFVWEPLPILRLMLPPFLISCGAALLIPYLNLYFQQRFQVRDDVLGTIFAGLGFAAGIGALLGPWLSARAGRMRAIVAVQMVSLPFLVLLGLSPLLWLAAAAALVRQTLFNAATPLYDVFAMERVQESMRPIAIAGINGAQVAGYAVMPLISTTVQAAYGFAPLFVVTGCLYAAAVVANYVLFLRPHRFAV